MTRDDLYHAAVPRMLAALVAQFSHAPRGTRIEAWTFDDQMARRAAEASLAHYGVIARFRSAYKPLVTFFREEVRPGFSAVHIQYPVHPAALGNRFLLESYPLAALLLPVVVDFVPGRSEDTYTVQLTYPDGVETHQVFAPNRVHDDVLGHPQLSPTGWLRTETRSERVETDVEALFWGAMAAIKAHPWPGTEPYFEELNIAVALPQQDEPLGYADEVLSLREAMHEDLYFSVLDYFGALSGRAPGDRHLQPGQIVPEVGAGDPAITIRLRPLTSDDRAGGCEPLATLGAPPSIAQVRAELDHIGGVAFQAQSRAGRRVDARWIVGTGAPVMISAGQHANETSPVVGALRAALALRDRGAAFTIAPVENPDGYALHGRLVRDNPAHMHHAARYTAFGNDLDARDGAAYENAIRYQAKELSGAGLHINLHGYPSHEWTRPMTGYVPRNFAMWTLPKGFFILLRHHAHWAEQARALADHITRDLGQIPGLLAQNDRQISLYIQHAGDPGFTMVNGFPCYIQADDRARVPMTLITEYPDETIYGAAFRTAHEAQMQTVILAWAAWQKLMPAAQS